MVKKILYFFNNIEFILGAFFSMVMVVILALQVVTRFVFNNPIAFAEELATILFIICIYLGAIGATRRNQHIRMEVVTSMLKKKTQLVVGIVSNIVFMITNTILIYGLVQITENLMRRGMRTAMLEIPKWTVYAVIPACLLLVTVRLIEDCAKKTRQIKEAKKPSGDDNHPPKELPDIID